MKQQAVSRSLLCCAMLAACALAAASQTPAPAAKDEAAQAREAAPAGTKVTGDLFGLEEVRRQLREQREEIERLRAALEEQTRVVTDLRGRVEQTERQQQEEAAALPGAPTAVTRNAAYATAEAPPPVTSADGRQPQKPPPSPGAAQQPGTVEERVGRVEEQAKRVTEAIARQLGSFAFSGDVNFRYEPIFGQLNASPNSDNPAIVGNPITSRHRFRVRLRFAARAQITKEFDLGFRLASGTFPDAVATNQTATDFFNRKPFAIDQAYVGYRPSWLPGFRAQAGKFEPPWTRTELTIDNDLMVEGLSAAYTREFKDSPLRSISLVAWDLPFLERQAAFVLGADGRVSRDLSGRAGRDLALYGAQVRARLQPSERVALTISAADLYYSGTQFITPAQFFGPQVQLPVTVTIPATATTPAQTVTGVATIQRDMLASGGQLGITTASNNAVGRDGRLASGFNLVDLIARLDLTHSKRFPVTLLLNYVRNTQANDVVSANSRGVSFVQPNRENQGFWTEVGVGKNEARGDLYLRYNFARIEKDAVLTPFNISEVLQQSDVRIHRVTVSYALDPRVILQFSAIVGRRANGLLGVFGATPPGSLNRPTTRLQFDTIFRF